MPQRHGVQLGLELTPVNIDALVSVTLQRREILHGRPRQLYVILDEAVLLRVLGKASVMAEQLGHLATLDAEPDVEIQITRLPDPQMACGPSFTLMTFANDLKMHATWAKNASGDFMVSVNKPTNHAMQDTFIQLSRDAVPFTTSLKLIGKFARDLNILCQE